MKVVKSYTDREIRIILEAIVEDVVRTHGVNEILKESDERNQVEITERGRETIKATLYAIASIITIDLPVIGWILGPLLTFFTFTGRAPDAVISLLEGKMGVDKFISTAENAAIKIATSANIPLIGQVLPDLDQITSMIEPDGSSKNKRGSDKRLSVLLFKKEGVLGNQAAVDAIMNHIKALKARSGGKLTTQQGASVIYAVDILLDLLTAAYLTRGKTVKKTKGRKKKDFKIPGGKEGFVSFGTLPSPYNYLKGIAPNDPVEKDIFNQVIEDEVEDIIDVEVEEVLFGDDRDTVTVSGVDYRQRTPELPYKSEDDPETPVDQHLRRQLQLDRPDDFDLDPDDLEEARYVRNLREQLEVIKIINRVLR